MPDLTGQVVLVTGAARRIGRGIALRLAQEGARVAVHYLDSEADARRTAEECGGELFRANLESVSEITRLFAAVEQRLGGLYGLVNNAARFTGFDPLEITEKDWDFIHSVNLKAVFFCCQQGGAAHAEVRRGPHRQSQFSGRHPALGPSCPLLLLESGSHYADACAGQGLCA